MVVLKEGDEISVMEDIAQSGAQNTFCNYLFAY